MNIKSTGHFVIAIAGIFILIGTQHNGEKKNAPQIYFNCFICFVSRISFTLILILHTKDATSCMFGHFECHLIHFHCAYYKKMVTLTMFALFIFCVFFHIHQIFTVVLIARLDWKHKLILKMVSASYALTLKKWHIVCTDDEWHGQDNCETIIIIKTTKCIRTKQLFFARIHFYLVH